MKKQVLVVGAGASGMTAAIYAARNGCSVTILESNEHVGKKLLATGNGKCNFTNQKMEASCFYSEDMEAVASVLSGFSFENTISFMKSLGIEPSEKKGYYYPASGQAASVVSALEMEMRHLGVKVRLGEKVILAEKKQRVFYVKAKRQQTVTSKEKNRSNGKKKTEKPVEPKALREGEKGKTEEIVCYRTDALIISCGSKAGLSIEKAVGGYELVKGFGHHLTKLVPALTGLQCNGDFFSAWSGVRIEGRVSIYLEDCLLAKDEGELQLTDYGISGIPVFQVSHYAARALLEKKKIVAELDFAPGKTQKEFVQFLLERQLRMPYKNIGQCLIGLFPEKLIPVFCRYAAIRTDGFLGKKEAELLARAVKQFILPVVASNPLKQAQVCAGGVCLGEINIQTMESVIVPGLYITGELLDAVGICGGYNLQWAWSTGAIAGKSVSQ